MQKLSYSLQGLVKPSYTINCNNTKDKQEAFHERKNI